MIPAPQKREDAPKSKKERKKVLLFLRNAIWCHDSSLISSFWLNSSATSHMGTRSAATAEKEEDETSEKWKSATLIRCRPFGRACPWFDGRGGGRDVANISFWKTACADWSWRLCFSLVFIAQRRPLVKSATAFCFWELCKKKKENLHRCVKICNHADLSVHQNPGNGLPSPFSTQTNPNPLWQPLTLLNPPITLHLRLRPYQRAIQPTLCAGGSSGGQA